MELLRWQHPLLSVGSRTLLVEGVILMQQVLCRWDVEDRFVISVHLPEAKQPIRLSLDLLLPQVLHMRLLLILMTYALTFSYVGIPERMTAAEGIASFLLSEAINRAVREDSGDFLNRTVRSWQHSLKQCIKTLVDSAYSPFESETLCRLLRWQSQLWTELPRWLPASFCTQLCCGLLVSMDVCRRLLACKSYSTGLHAISSSLADQRILWQLPATNTSTVARANSETRQREYGRNKQYHVPCRPCIHAYVIQ